jgi:hypothetical protein
MVPEPIAGDRKTPAPIHMVEMRGCRSRAESPRLFRNTRQLVDGGSDRSENCMCEVRQRSTHASIGVHGPKNTTLGLVHSTDGKLRDRGRGTGLRSPSPKRQGPSTLSHQRSDCEVPAWCATTVHRLIPQRTDIHSDPLLRKATVPPRCRFPSPPPPRPTARVLQLDVDRPKPALSGDVPASACGMRVHGDGFGLYCMHDVRNIYSLEAGDEMYLLHAR